MNEKGEEKNEWVLAFDLKVNLIINNAKLEKQLAEIRELENDLVEIEQEIVSIFSRISTLKSI